MCGLSPGRLLERAGPGRQSPEAFLGVRAPGSILAGEIPAIGALGQPMLRIIMDETFVADRQAAAGHQRERRHAGDESQSCAPRHDHLISSDVFANAARTYCQPV